MYTEKELDIIQEALNIFRGLIEASNDEEISTEEIEELWNKIENYIVECPWCGEDMLQIEVDQRKDYEYQEWACSSCEALIQIWGQVGNPIEKKEDSVLEGEVVKEQS